MPIAIITGGVSSMGLAVAEALSARGDWVLHLIDVNSERGLAVEKSVRGAQFHKADITSYASLASVFESVHRKEGRLDFVFANAGIVERWNFYQKHEGEGPPPEPDQLSIEIDLKSVVSTTYLAQHYFRLSKKSYGTGKQALVMTSSCGGLYPSPFCPMYTAAKHGVVGLTRAVAKHFYFKDKIRVSCICPGTVRTNLLDEAGWSQFPDTYFTKVEKIVEVVLMLVDGGKMEDSKGVVKNAGQDWSLTVEVNGTNHYFREQPEWCDKNMEELMVATDVPDTGANRVFSS